jgi:plastocyanin
MLKQLFRSMELSGLLALGFGMGVLLLIPHPASAAQTEIKIKPKGGGPVFDKPDISIKVGDTVQWTPLTTPDTPHRLLPDSQSDAFIPTPGKNDDFFSTTTPPVTQTFNSTGVIHYHCFYHPATMIGTITVTP